MKKEKTVGVFGAESVDTEPEQKENPMKQEPEKTESKQIEKQKRKKDKLWIAIAAAVALIAANVLLFVIIVQHGGKTAVSAVETAEAAEIDDSASEAEASPNAEATEPGTESDGALQGAGEENPEFELTAVPPELLDQYMNVGIYELESMDVLKLDPLKRFGAPAKIVKLFGGKDGYLKAVRKLEELIYIDEAS